MWYREKKKLISTYPFVFGFGEMAGFCGTAGGTAEIIAGNFKKKKTEKNMLRFNFQQRQEEKDASML